MKMNRLFFLLFALSLMAVSCSERIEDMESEQVANLLDIATFKNNEEYQNSLIKVLSMSTNELKEYEESIGYLSFGRECEEFYNSIDFESFATFEELESFVEANSDYLVFNKDDNGELYLETVYCNSIDRYIMNKDRMFLIGDDIYKVFEDGVIISDASNLDDLKKINFNSIDKVAENKDYRFVKSNKTITNAESKDMAYDCGVFAEAKSDDGRDRTRIQISVEHHYGQYANHIWTDIYCEAIVRPLKRQLGVWIWCSRTISGDINVAYDYYDPTWGWQRSYFSGSNPGTGDSKWVVPHASPVDDYFTDVYHLAGYDCWADTPSTPPAILQRNTELF